MTEYIVKEGLLSQEEVRELQATVPKELMDGVSKWRGTGEEIDWEDYFKEMGVRPQSFCDPIDDEEELG